MSDQQNEVEFPSMPVKREEVPKQVRPPDYVYELNVISVTPKRTSGRNLAESGKGLPAGILAADVLAEITTPAEVDGVDCAGMRANCYFVLGTESDPDCADPQTRAKGGFRGGFARFTNLLDALGIQEWNLRDVPELAKGRYFTAMVKTKTGDDGYTNVNFTPPDPDHPRKVGAIGAAQPVAASKPAASSSKAPAATGNCGGATNSKTVTCDEEGCGEKVVLKDYAKHKAAHKAEAKA